MKTDHKVSTRIHERQNAETMFSKLTEMTANVNLAHELAFEAHAKVVQTDLPLAYDEIGEALDKANVEVKRMLRVLCQQSALPGDLSDENSDQEGGVKLKELASAKKIPKATTKVTITEQKKAETKVEIIEVIVEVSEEIQEP